jgi:hypothetical protein
MKLRLEWTRQISLRSAAQQNLIYSVDQDKLPSIAGVYVFGRRYSDGFEALYVGKANDIRGRLRDQFKNLPLMMHIKNAKSGKRVLLTAYFKAKPGQKLAKCLTLIERALIRYFLSEGHDLVNKQGTRIRRHEIASSQIRLIPRVMFLDRSKSE